MKKVKLIILIVFTICFSNCNHIDYSNIDINLICKSCNSLRSIETRDCYYDIFFKNHQTRLMSINPECKFYYKNKSCHIDDSELKQDLVSLIKMLEKFHIRKLYVEGDDYLLTTYDEKLFCLSRNGNKWKNKNRVFLEKNWFYFEK